MGLRLIIEDYEGSTTVFPLGEGAVTIGREEGNTIQLPEQNISRKHLRLLPSDDGWVLEDLQSYNGVRVNGAVVESASIIHEGDLIQIGDYQLLIGDETSTRATMDLGPALVAAANDGNESAAAAEPALRAERPTLEEELPSALVVPTALADEDFDAIESKGGGGKVALVVLLLGALGGGAWFMMNRGGDAGGQQASAAQGEAATAKASDAGDAIAAGADGDATAATGADEGEALVDEGEALVDEGEALADEGELVADEGGPTGEEDPVEEDPVEEDPVEEDPVQEDPVEAAPTQTPTQTPTKAKKKKKKAPAPTKSADELLADARKAQIAKSYSKAYKLAKQAYGVSPSAEAAQVMGVAACKMGDASKAKSAYNKLSGSKKSALKNVCAASGIEL